MAVVFRSESDRIRSNLISLVEGQIQNQQQQTLTSSALAEAQRIIAETKTYLGKIDPKLVGEVRTLSKNAIVRLAADAYYSIRQVFAKIFFNSTQKLAIFKAAETTLIRAQALTIELSDQAIRIQVLLANARSELVQAEKLEREQAEQLKAAGFIQKLYRGHQARKQFKVLKDEVHHRQRRAQLAGYIPGLIAAVLIASKLLNRS